MEKYDYLIFSPQIGICGQDCKHCYVKDKLRRNKSLSEAKHLLDRFAEVLAEPAITEHALFYTMDELTLFPNVLGLLSYARDINILPVPTLSTNGAGIAVREDWEDILQALKDSGVHGFNMSFFGEREYHDWFTGREGSFDRALKATRRAEENGLWVHWNLFLTSQNVEQLARVSSMKSDTKKTFSIPGEVPRWKHHADIHAGIDVFEKIPDELRQFVRDDFHSEREWIEQILSGEFQSEEEDCTSEPAQRIKGIIQSGDTLYLTNIYPGFEIGSIAEASLRDQYEDVSQPPGAVFEENMDLVESAKRLGIRESDKAYTIHHLHLKWLVESLQDDHWIE
ncbi:MAG: radical SAM protein [Candidatus Aegiribacteria sp.]|nr:radical SAM protein [Candidatus Aegiribacteria sp.]